MTDTDTDQSNAAPDARHVGLVAGLASTRRGDWVPVYRYPSDSSWDVSWASRAENARWSAVLDAVPPIDDFCPFCEAGGDIVSGHYTCDSCGIQHYACEPCNAGRDQGARFVVDGDDQPCALSDLYPDGEADSEVLALSVGESTVVGGGASPATTIRRVA